MEENFTQSYVSSLSHNLRTPLNGILGYCQLLSQTKLDSTQQMYINRANHCCVQLVEIVNDILDFSKLVSGKGKINNQCFAFKEIIEEVNAAISQPIKEKKQKLRYILDEQLPEYIISDKQKIIQILINLISNANKFSAVNGRIITQISPHGKDMIEFTVEDNGIGITKEEQNRLFTPFTQLNQISKEGSGLGLAISKKLVELLGGKISIESEKDKGTIFTFTVKYNVYHDFEKEIEKNSTYIKDKYILVVDDNIDNRLILNEMLFEFKINPITCSSAKEALKYINSKRYSFAAILLDICMPDVSGTVLAKQIKDINPEIPLIALSSMDDSFDTSNFEQVISKPINKIKLLDTLIRVITKGTITECELNVVKEEEKIVTEKRDISILIAEDISYNSDMLTKMLNNMGYNKIDVAEDGEIAIKKIDEQFTKNDPYDILLLDLKMPKLDGFGVAEHIKKSNYNTLKTAVVTASILENDKNRCKVLGIKYFLQKPFVITQLKNIINRLVNGTS